MRKSTLLVLLFSCLAALTPAAEAAGGNPLEKTDGFYVDPDSNPAVWAAQHPGTDADAVKAAIATKPGARWFGNWSGDIRTAVDSYTYAADVADKLPILVAYNIPGRDCSGESHGGAGSTEAYQNWISEFAAGIGGKPALVIIEPDALAQLDCLPEAARAPRTDLLRFAAQQFAEKAPNTWAYLDGGNATWVPAPTMAARLDAAGVRTVHGFALNVSNFYATAESTTYGKAVDSALGYSAPFVVDTSRNGNGANGQWCNPPGRALGVTSRVGGGPEMQLWVKVPGDSDGSCGLGDGIPAGTFSPVLAKALMAGV